MSAPVFARRWLGGPAARTPAQGRAPLAGGAPLARVQDTRAALRAAMGGATPGPAAGGAPGARWQDGRGSASIGTPIGPLSPPPLVAAPVASAAPALSIVGTPGVTATQDGREVNSPNQVSLFLGDFAIDAQVRVQAPGSSSLADWDVGIVQMMSGAVDAGCYRRLRPRPGDPPDQRVFVEKMHAPTQMFHPDRDPASAVFVDSASMANLGAAAGGRASFDVRLRTEDHPSYRGRWGFASAYTNSLGDTDVELFRVMHRGFFYTYVVGRQQSTGLLVPLYVARWWLASEYGYFSPGNGIDFTATNRGSLTFRLIDHHPFSSADFFPNTSGETMQQLSLRREQSWRASCPGFVELGGGQ